LVKIKVNLYKVSFETTMIPAPLLGIELVF